MKNGSICIGGVTVTPLLNTSVHTEVSFICTSYVKSCGSSTDSLLHRREDWLLRVSDLLGELEAAMGQVERLSEEIEQRSGSLPGGG
jgi:hypothetical protein